MPICPKCGKSFSSEQALSYHLNKKYKCGTWKCGACSSVFDTKFALKIHAMSCSDGYTSLSMPSYDILCKLYALNPHVIYELDNNDIIHSVSPSYTKHFGAAASALVGNKLDSVVEHIDGRTYHVTSSGEHVHVSLTKIDDTLCIETVM